MRTDDVFKSLPKYVHGEFKNAKRRVETLEKKVKELEVLRDIEIDTAQFFNPDLSDKYYLRWLDRMVEKGSFEREEPEGLKAFAFQSCWPEESTSMIFQYLYKFLDVRFKWWSAACWEKDYLVLKEKNPRIVNGALPNINGLYYACAGDYGEKLKFGSKVSKSNELLNYTSSPNLRENSQVTSIYTRVAMCFQYCDVEVKRGAETETTYIAALIGELFEKASNEELSIPYDSIRQKCCDSCLHDPSYVGKNILFPDGSVEHSLFEKVLSSVNGDDEKAQMLMTSIPVENLIALTSRAPSPSVCRSCVFGKESSGKIKKVSLHKEYFDKSWEDYNKVRNRFENEAVAEEGEERDWEEEEVVVAANPYLP